MSLRLRPALAALAAATALLLHACGGGVEGQGTGSVSYSEGPIGGFGSIIVNGVRYDERSARIVDEDGGTLTSADLRLGMTVRVDGGAIDPVSLSAVATDVQVTSDLRGRVAAKDAVAGTLTVLGQTVRVTAATAFDEALAGGLGAVAVGSTVEVYAILDPVTGAYAAQRVEPDPSPSDFKLRGVVAGLDLAARMLRIGGATFTWAQGVQPAGLANGQTVRLTLQTATDAQGRWVVTRFDDGVALPPDGAEVEIESVVASYTSLASFTVAGVRVDASAARVEPAGATVAAGVRVEVEGHYRGGVLVADQVEVKGSGDDGGDDDGREVELHGAISGLDTVARTFVLRGLTVDYAQADFKDGTAADLANGVEVEVHGRLDGSGTVVVAEEIDFED
ncbi:DUF5666 domain-containing protein [Ideonella sp.]|uniref:DUF5666 domain-containing protein n=1 Tax=Ideonella sp. TaxID=1929293 RepID=UPI0035B179A2